MHTQSSVHDGTWTRGARAPWIVPIPGTTKARRLQENLRVAAVESSCDDLPEIDSVASEASMTGVSPGLR
jgi:aryl-alcohol dehydrogenase-like predicted oxidoreductase